MRNIALKLRYDGSRYHGWQVQKNEISVCQTVEQAVEATCGKAHVIGCGRTDAGVHANRYCANFRTESTIPIERIPLAINSRLPMDIAVLDAVEAPEDFNAIGSCIKKEYIYRIHNTQRLDLDRMKKAAEAFVGTHDFKAVRSVGTETKTTVRTVHWCDVSKQENLITVAICADGFLYNMCRAIVGTLVYASYGKLEPEEIPALLELGDRRLTGPTMPPQGLYMNRLWYDGAVGEMMMRNGTPDGELLHPMIKSN